MSKIYEFCSFFNENLIAQLKAKESSKWMDKLVIHEADYTFSYKEKGFLLDSNLAESEFITYKKLNVTSRFKKNGYGMSRIFPYFRFKNRSWHNETIQREFNTTIKELDVKDDDILIFSDIDEIIDSRKAQELIKLVNIHNIITVKLHYSLFYLNLFSEDWAGPKDYSYRVFIMTGSHFRKLECTVDQLRKKGERGELVDEVFCPNDFYGFHHSWLGDENKILEKLEAYSHTPDEHDGSISSQGKYDINVIRSKLLKGESIYKGHKLKINNDLDFLSSIDEVEGLSGYYLNE
ncbi:hypothetical protein MCX36_05310 [Vibrio aestuarianus]|uniref:hypothetical protein n=1 Tax=Vibrio aestuarianus TaxID=28171 RepID=UPI001592E211|nr:hypothetical protein [Vibrio aestuarianus]MDE1309877.1 hypothetical protein [Vibrio aestuarianus]NGZ19359.1 hypothetical protein [Vibrio aestuarianus]